MKQTSGITIKELTIKEDVYKVTTLVSTLWQSDIWSCATEVKDFYGKLKV